MTQPAAPDPQPGTPAEPRPSQGGTVPPMPSEVNSAHPRAPWPAGGRMAQGHDAAEEDGTQNPPPPIAPTDTRPPAAERDLTHPGAWPRLPDRKHHGPPGGL